MSTVGLFIPCYVDQLFPQVGLATLDLLEAGGFTVVFPSAQTCCGQPMANTGCTSDAKPLAERFLEIFAPFDYVVAPSGSCVSMVRNHYAELLHGDERYAAVRNKTFELCEFLTDVAPFERPGRSFPHRVGLHQSCHGLRELKLGRPSELNIPGYNKARALLEQLDGIQIVDLQRADECCGFGGTFAVSEAAVSATMGSDRVADHLASGAEVLRVMHIAEILAGRPV
jgi:L-lactate dehydrogenase complex protein LldE